MRSTCHFLLLLVVAAAVDRSFGGDSDRRPEESNNEYVRRSLVDYETKQSLPRTMVRAEISKRLRQLAGSTSVGGDRMSKKGAKSDSKKGGTGSSGKKVSNSQAGKKTKDSRKGAKPSPGGQPTPSPPSPGGRPTPGSGGQPTEPGPAFDISDCESYSDDWLFDLAQTCNDPITLEDCECLSAAEKLSDGELTCATEEQIGQSPPACPEVCPVCQFCMVLIGCPDIYGVL